MSDTNDTEDLVKHPPASKVGNMRVPNPRRIGENHDLEVANETHNVPVNPNAKASILLAGSSPNKKTLTEEVKHYQEKPLPTHDPAKYNPRTVMNIFQPPH